MTEQQKAVLDKIAELIAKMNDEQLERWLDIGEGMAIMMSLMMKAPDPPQKTA